MKQNSKHILKAVYELKVVHDHSSRLPISEKGVSEYPNQKNVKSFDSGSCVWFCR